MSERNSATWIRVLVCRFTAVLTFIGAGFVAGAAANGPNATPVGGAISSDATTSHGAFIVDLVRIPSGEFLMGNPEPEQFGQYSRCEGPQHRVRIRQPFLMSKFEITVRQFRIFAESTGYQTDAERSGEGVNGLDVQSGQVVQRPQCIWKNPGFEQQDDHPVVCVSWHDAAAFCRWLTQQTGRNCRLPTEAEWEYCCRGGSETTFFTGDDVELLKTVANCGDQSLTEVCSAALATANWDDAFAFTAPVGSFSANAFGLHDMHGNVGEWCQDWFDATYYTAAEVDDPMGPEQPMQWRVVRGGSWYNAPAGCRSSGRHDGIATAASTTNGFRIVVEQVE